MKTLFAAASDYEFVRKLLDRVTRIERNRRLTPEEAKPIRAVRERWQIEGQAFALVPNHRERLSGLVRKIELRLQAAPYAPFC